MAHRLSCEFSISGGSVRTAVLVSADSGWPKSGGMQLVVQI